MQDQDRPGLDPLTAIPVPKAGAPEASASGARERILVVDNDARIVELLAWFLGKRGFDVRTAGSFGEARERLAEGLPDLMLSDLDLGAESALEELPRLEQDGLLPPTLVVSGYLDASSTERLTGMGPVLGTLSKPFDFAALEERVVTCLRGVTRGEAPAAAGAGLGDSVLGGSGLPGPGPATSEPVDGEAWVEIVPTARPLPRTNPSSAPGATPAGSLRGPALGQGAATGLGGGPHLGC